VLKTAQVFSETIFTPEVMRLPLNPFRISS